MKFIRTYRYEIIAAVGGAVVMILELVGARMVAPFFGTSIYVWTAMIGVILGALSLGYWYGGVLADRTANDQGLMRVVTIAALAIFLCVIVQEAFLGAISALRIDVRIATLVVATVLFAPAALLLGVVSPYVAKLRVSSLKTAGRSIGRLYAAGTFGSIIGTFLAGYWLIGWFGNRTLGFSLVVVLILLSFLAFRHEWRVRRVVLGVAALFGAILPYNLPFGVIADIDSAYSRYIVRESRQGVPQRLLMGDPFSVQSAQFIEQPDVLALEYSERFMRLARTFAFKDILIVGGGAYSFPSVAAEEYPDRTVHTVEIDPKLTEVATQYFSLKSRPNLRIYHEDGRTFLNRADAGSYDIVFLDAFSSLTPPYQLTTREATLAAKRSLRPGGLIVANVIASQNDPYGMAMAATYRSAFASVGVYQVHPSIEPSDRQNLIVVLTEDQAQQNRAQEALQAPSLDIPSGMVLTDDFAPVEQLIHR